MKEITMYQTADNKIFEDKEDAIEHEKDLIKKNIVKIVKQIQSFCDSTECYLCPFNMAGGNCQIGGSCPSVWEIED